MGQTKKEAPEIKGEILSPKKPNKNKWLKSVIWLIIICVIIYMGVQIINMNKQQSVNSEKNSSATGQNQGGAMQGLTGSDTGGPPPDDMGGAPPSGASGDASSGAPPSN